MTVRCGCAPVPHARPHSTRNTMTSRGSFSCPCPRSRNPRMGTAAKLIVHQRLFPSSTCTTRKVARPFSMACPSLLRGVIKEGSFPTATMEGPNRAKGGGTVLWRLRDISAPFSQHVKQVCQQQSTQRVGKRAFHCGLPVWPRLVSGLGIANVDGKLSLQRLPTPARWGTVCLPLRLSDENLR